MSDVGEDYDLIVNCLNSLIKTALSEAGSEQSAPMHQGDASDERIRYALERAVKLRAIRNQFEEVMTGAILGLGATAPGLDVLGK